MILNAADIHKISGLFSNGPLLQITTHEYLEADRACQTRKQLGDPGLRRQAHLGRDLHHRREVGGREAEVILPPREVEVGVKVSAGAGAGQDHQVKTMTRNQPRRSKPIRSRRWPVRMRTTPQRRLWTWAILRKVKQRKISNQRKHLCPQARVNLTMRMTWPPLKHLQPLAFLQERMMTKTWSRPKRWTPMCLSGSLFMIRTKKIKP